jgi:outer membrane protein TolC
MMLRLSMRLFPVLLFFVFPHCVDKIAAAEGVYGTGGPANGVHETAAPREGVAAEIRRSARSLNFAEAANLAVAASVDLRNAYASQGLREQAWTLGLRAYFPRLGISVSENDRLAEIGADSFVKNYGINLDQLLWDGGRTSMARTLERTELNLAYNQLERAAADVAEAALSAYRNVLSSRAVLSIRESSIETLSQQRRILAEEVALGLALAVDLAEADLTLASMKIEILSLRSDLAEMEQQYAEILGLDALPELSEKVDVNRAALLPEAGAALRMAQERNPELGEMRYSIFRKQGELKYAARQWIPSFRLQGSFGLTGKAYPLTRYTWSVGLSIELSGPWLQNSFNIQAGWEPPYDRTAQLQNSLVPAPDPQSALTRKQAEQALVLEQEKYRLAFERAGRAAERGVERCLLADRKRGLALEAQGIAAERFRLEELRLALGQITRLELMEALLQYTQMEIASVNAAAALLETERELERLLDLKPGELAGFAAIKFSVRPERSE